MDSLSLIASVIGGVLAGAGAAVKLSYSVFDRAMDRKFFAFQQQLMDRLDNTYVRNKEVELRFQAVKNTMDLLVDGMRIIRTKLDKLDLDCVDLKNGMGSNH